jgi:hypothetical protein
MSSMKYIIVSVVQLRDLLFSVYNRKMATISRSTSSRRSQRSSGRTERNDHDMDFLNGFESAESAEQIQVPALSERSSSTGLSDEESDYDDDYIESLRKQRIKRGRFYTVRYPRVYHLSTSLTTKRLF